MRKEDYKLSKKHRKNMEQKHIDYRMFRYTVYIIYIWNKYNSFIPWTFPLFSWFYLLILKKKNMFALTTNPTFTARGTAASGKRSWLGKLLTWTIATWIWVDLKRRWCIGSILVCIYIYMYIYMYVYMKILLHNIVYLYLYLSSHLF